MEKLPKCPKDVTEEWLKYVMSKYLKNSNISVISLERITEKDGFSCGIYKASIQCDESELLKLFIKVILAPEEPNAAFVLGFSVDQIEIEALRIWVPKLIEFEKTKTKGQSELENMMPKFYAGDYSLDKENRGFYLILEDISSDFKILKDDAGTFCHVFSFTKNILT